MPSTTKISLLALAGSAAAVPHVHNHMHARHDKYHHVSSKGYAGPTGGWANVNATRPAPTALPNGEKITTIDTTSTSTTTVVSTVTVPRPKSDKVGVADATGAGEVCGPPTVYVTATEKVTVTVPAGGLPSSSVVASSEGVFSILPVSSSSSGYVVVSTSKPVAAPTKPVEVPSKAPSSEAPAVSVPATSSVKKEDKPTTSKAPEVSPPASSAKPSEPAPKPSSSTAPSSSAAPSPKPSSSAPATYAGGKRGLVYKWDGAADCKSFASKFKAGFAWNWEADSRGDIGGIPFIPTLRTLATAGDWSSKVDAAIKAGSKVVFGFNEPDKPDQANLGVAAACEAWTKYMNPIASKHPEVNIVGPSVSSDVAKGTGLDWLSQFKSQCPGAIYHSSNIHWYGYGNAGFDDFKAHVDKAISQFGKVWVTEFGLHGQSQAASKAFLEKALPYLDSNPDCLGYSYFAVGTFDPAFNMLGTGSSLTETGKVYVAQ